MPPQLLQAGPRSRPTMRTGTTGGVSVIAEVAGFAAAGAGVGAASAFGALLPLAGPAVSLDGRVFCAIDLARTSAVMMPSSSWVSASSQREASQRMM